MQWYKSNELDMVLDFMLVLRHAVIEKWCISHGVLWFYTYADECGIRKVY